MNSMIEKMSELNISEEVMKEVLFVAKRMDEKGLVNSFAGNISAKERWENLYYPNRPEQGTFKC